VGKTTLLERAVTRLRQRGLTVLAVKSSHHSWQDQPGSDSERLGRAGATGVALLGANASQLYLDPPLSPQQLLPLLRDRFQAALIEGGKSSPYPKVELLDGLSPPLLPEHLVVARLLRGQPDCDLACERFLHLWESEGQIIEAANR
jgi:molybdopterin-guanine dinucleotide biosynthesis protein MobB